MMAFLLETEYGAESTIKLKKGDKLIENLDFDKLLDNALDQVIFKKYMKWARL